VIAVFRHVGIDDDSARTTLEARVLAAVSALVRRAGVHHLIGVVTLNHRPRSLLPLRQGHSDRITTGALVLCLVLRTDHDLDLRLLDLDTDLRLAHLFPTVAPRPSGLPLIRHMDFLPPPAMIWPW